MAAYRPGIDWNRRKGPDKWLKLLRWLAAAGWSLIFAALLLLGKAKPEIETFFDRFYGIKLRPTWDLALAEYILLAMIACLCISALGLLVNLCRHRRKSDEWRANLILLVLFSIFGIATYLVSFQ